MLEFFLSFSLTKDKGSTKFALTITITQTLQHKITNQSKNNQYQVLP